MTVGVIKVGAKVGNASGKQALYTRGAAERVAAGSIGREIGISALHRARDVFNERVAGPSTIVFTSHHEKGFIIHKIGLPINLFDEAKSINQGGRVVWKLHYEGHSIRLLECTQSLLLAKK